MKRVLMPIGILLGSIVVAVVLIRNPTRVSESAPEIIPISVRVAEVQTAHSPQALVEGRLRRLHQRGDPVRIIRAGVDVGTQEVQHGSEVVGHRLLLRHVAEELAR